MGGYIQWGPRWFHLHTQHSTGWVMIARQRQWTHGILNSNWVLKAIKNTSEPLVEGCHGGRLQFAAETTGTTRAAM